MSNALFSQVKLLRILLSNVIEKAHNRFSNNIAPDEWSLLRHAKHDKCASLCFACGDQRSCVESSPRTTRDDYTALQIFLFLSLRQSERLPFMMSDIRYFFVE